MVEEMQKVATYESYNNQHINDQIATLLKEGHVIDNISRSSALAADGRMLHTCTIIYHKEAIGNF